MKIRIPDLDGEPQYIDGKQSIVLIGANGAGKTRMSVWIDEHNPDINIHRISAQKSLNMPEAVHTGEMSSAEENLLFGTTNRDKSWLKTHGKKSRRWGGKPEIHMLDDYSQLMEYLLSESSEKAIAYRKKHKDGDISFDNTTRLEHVQRIWEDVIRHRKLHIHSGKIEVTEDGQEADTYNGSEMSDGERAVFYYIGEVLCAQPDSLIIIDEPENHLHEAIIVRLWNAVERERQDCTFLYITHNVDFARTRLNSQVIWVKDMHVGSVWDYELLDVDQFSDSLLLSILGSRQKVLFVEGTPDRSIDRMLYSMLFQDYNIIPLEGCASVIAAVKAYRKTKRLHYAEIKGIVDRDRRSEKEITELRGDNIFVPLAAEVENLFMLPEVIIIAAAIMRKENVEQIIEEVKARTFSFIEAHLEEQALLFTRQRCQNKLIKRLNSKTTTLEDYKKNIASLPQIIDIKHEYDIALDELKAIVRDRDFLKAIKVINNKGLLPETNLPNKFGWTKDNYISNIIRWTGCKDDYGRQLREAFKAYITLS